MRKLPHLMVVFGVLICTSPAAAQQSYPPPPAGCTAEERVAFNQSQRAETLAFQQEQKDRRRNFDASGPHTAEEKKEFNQKQRDRKQTFKRRQRQERKDFIRSCQASRPVRSAATGIGVPAARPAITVGHISLILMAGLLLVLLRGAVRAKTRR